MNESKETPNMEQPKTSAPCGLSAATCYAKYRGKCKEMVEEACRQDPTLTPVRGHYICWSWGKQAHWWAVKPDGTIVDPTVGQFPKPHIGDYIPFDDVIECSHCGKRVAEEHATFYGSYAFCSGSCNIRFVGL
jgi:hypothetical protein